MTKIQITILAIIALAAIFAFIEALADDNVIETAHKDFDRKEFHLLGWTRRAFVISTAVLVHFGFAYIALEMLTLAGITFWLVFEAVISCRLVGSPFFVGSSAYTDKLIRKLAWLMDDHPEDVKQLLMLLALCVAVVVALTQF
jgi:protein-S-isoprenylcysteine O-methyltransferase Ste14